MKERKYSNTYIDYFTPHKIPHLINQICGLQWSILPMRIPYLQTSNVVKKLYRRVEVPSHLSKPQTVSTPRHVVLYHFII